MKTITVRLGQPSAPSEAIRPPGDWGVVKTSYEVEGKSRMTMIDSGNWQQLAVPDVYRHNPTDLKFSNGEDKKQFVPMDEKFQHWL